jgi:sulfur carrier protein
MTITVMVNGDERQLDEGTTVAGLLDSLGLHPRLVVVEHNREILDAGALDATEIRAGDNLELVHFVGGG